MTNRQIAEHSADEERSRVGSAKFEWLQFLEEGWGTHEEVAAREYFRSIGADLNTMTRCWLGDSKYYRAARMVQ